MCYQLRVQAMREEETEALRARIAAIEAEVEEREAMHEEEHSALTAKISVLEMDTANGGRRGSLTARGRRGGEGSVTQRARRVAAAHVEAQKITIKGELESQIISDADTKRSLLEGELKAAQEEARKWELKCTEREKQFHDEIESIQRAQESDKEERMQRITHQDTQLELLKQGSAFAKLFQWKREAELLAQLEVAQENAIACDACVMHKSDEANSIDDATKYGCRSADLTAEMNALRDDNIRVMQGAAFAKLFYWKKEAELLAEIEVAKENIGKGSAEVQQLKGQNEQLRVQVKELEEMLLAEDDDDDEPGLGDEGMVVLADAHARRMSAAVDK